MVDIITQIVGRAVPPKLADLVATTLRSNVAPAPLVLFGAGSAGVRLRRGLHIHGVEVTCFCDNNPASANDTTRDLPVLSPTALKETHPDASIVVAVSPQHAEQVVNQLLELGFPGERVLVPPRDQLFYYTNVAKLYWTRQDLDAHRSALQETHDALADDLSRRLFAQRMALLTGGIDYRAYCDFIATCATLRAPQATDLFTFPRYDDDHFYFNSEFFPLANDEVFANVGALTGDCALTFAQSCAAKGLSYGEIINFEPDLRNFAQLEAKLAHLPRVRSFPFGLFSRRATLRFSNPSAAGGGTPGKLDENGEFEVDVAALDELLPDANITLMKLDVEGAELDALHGAAKTIRRCKPKLAISVYHKRDDIFELPLFVRQLHPGYKLFLRHFSTTFSETTLLAVP